MNEPAPSSVYRERADRFSAQRDALARRSSLLANARLVAFALVITFGVLLERTPSTLLLVALAAVATAFVALVALHRRTRSRERWLDSLASQNREGLDRLARNWDALPVRVPSRSIDGHAYATDLDLFGRASVSQILGTTATPAGCSMLDDWLLERAAPGEVALRQEAVRELAPLIDLRDTLALHGRATRSIRPRDVAAFLDWAESPGWALDSTRLRLAAWILPAATWLLGAAQALGFTNRGWWMAPLAATFIAYFTVGARARRTFDAAFGREPLFAHYPDMIATVTAPSFRSTMLRDIATRLKPDGTPASERIGALARLMHLADLRLSTIHLPVFLLTMWDVHVLFALERWQRANGAAVRDWLDALGAAEALSALATLAHDEPDWKFADIGVDGERRLHATSLGHPLIPAGVRVNNDVTVGPPGTFLLITGSNMSGKSTLLRAIGVNAILAQAGAPVCADALTMPSLDVQTSIRVQDSLARGVSYFMAELERLKQVVDAAHHARDTGSATMMFLLDEILHGTNTAERRIAATRVIRHLVDTGAIGAATTHDLSLAEEDALADAAQLVHFTETVDDAESELKFDYQLRDGLATSTNALALMRMVGLEFDDRDA